MLKMDFLGLKTLSILRDALKNVKKRHGIEIDIDNIPLDDKKTFELYQRGDTVGTFQFESDGMRKYLRELKPTDIEDLIAMNALYRPGPMSYIPEYISRKHGTAKTEYPHPLLEPILKNTYGIMIYQEQIMQAAQVVAGYSLGGADLLRRAMGKKDKVKMAEERNKFIKGAATLNNIDEKKANEIFDVMEKFAEYGFNRSHSAAYSILAYQTGYLKANYPAEFMASVLSRSKDHEDTTFFLDECKRMGLIVLGPDINESEPEFSVNSKGQIRFGLKAIKGLGEAAITSLIEERQRGGAFHNLADLLSRIQARSLNRRAIEALVYAGAFDSFEGTHRAQYFATLPGESVTVIEKVIKLSGNASSSSHSMMNSLFGDLPIEKSSIQIRFPEVEPWSTFDKLRMEKEVTGIYLSGHPLDNYKLEIKRFCNCNLSALDDIKDTTVSFACIVSNVNNLVSKNQKPFGVLDIEDISGTKNLRVFGENYLRFKHFFVNGNMLYIEGKNQKNRFGDTYEFVINKIILLQDLRNTLCNKIKLRMAVHAVNDEIINRLEQMISRYPGNFPLEFEILDKDNINLILNSPRLNVSLDDEFIRECYSIPEFELILN
jgi:DNA polymerase-3 subunit alpha